MDSEWIQVRMRRSTMDRLRNYGDVLQARGLMRALSNAHMNISPDAMINRLLDSWEKQRSRSFKAALKRRRVRK